MGSPPLLEVLRRACSTEKGGPDNFEPLLLVAYFAGAAPSPNFSALEQRLAQVIIHGLTGEYFYLDKQGGVHRERPPVGP